MKTQRNRKQRWAVGLALISFLNPLLVPAASAKGRAAASIRLVARVLPVAHLQAGQPQVSDASATASVYGTGASSIVVVATITGGAKEKAVLRIPLAMSTNVKNFVLRANVEGQAQAGSVYLDPGQSGNAVISRPFPLSGNQVFAMGSANAQGTPLMSTLEISVDPVPQDQVRTFKVTVAMENQGS